MSFWFPVGLGVAVIAGGMMGLMCEAPDRSRSARAWCAFLVALGTILMFGAIKEESRYYQLGRHMYRQARAYEVYSEEADQRVAEMLASVGFDPEGGE